MEDADGGHGFSNTHKEVMKRTVTYLYTNGISLRVTNCETNMQEEKL